ncbi:MAG: hypothetical protein JXR03_18485 [Cyclobacteriaceae bacterium]
MKNANAAQQKTTPQKEDHLAPTKIEEPKPVSAPERTENLSEAELENKFQVHEHVTNQMYVRSTVASIKEKYRDEQQRRTEIRTKVGINYAMGERAGLPQARHDAIALAKEIESQHLRDATAKELTEDYKKHAPLPKLFDEHGHPKASAVKQEFWRSHGMGKGQEEKSKGKDMDMEK